MIFSGIVHESECSLKTAPSYQSAFVSAVAGELQYEYVLINGKRVKTLIDGGLGVVCVKSTLISSKTNYIGSTILTGAFGDTHYSKLTKIKITDPQNNKSMIVTAAVCEKLITDLILPPKIYHVLTSQNQSSEFKMSQEQKNYPIHVLKTSLEKHPCAQKNETQKSFKSEIAGKVTQVPFDSTADISQTKKMITGCKNEKNDSNPDAQNESVQKNIPHGR